MSKVSIIVPVYNAERYLERCIVSILGQTHTNLELILVNDGSKDSGGMICDKWAATDSRVRVIHQNNQGASAARNAGLDIATGEYIGFVDADDYIAPETYETTLAHMEGNDIVMWDAVTVWSDGRTEPDTIPLLKSDCTINRQDWSPELLRQMAGSVWRCLYTASRMAGIRFQQGVKFSEDRLFNLYAMGQAENLYYMKTPLYYRLMHSESAVHRYHEDYFEANITAHKAIVQALEEKWSNDPAYIQRYNRQLIGGAMGAVCNYFYKTSPLSLPQQWRKTKLLCNDGHLRMVLSETEGIGLVGTLLSCKCVLALCTIAWLMNKKHGR